MRKIQTFFYSLKRSLFDPAYYTELAKGKFLFSYKYLLFLFLCLMVIQAVQLDGTYIASRSKIQPAINTFIKNAELFYPPNLELTVADGQLSTNVPEPYYLDFSSTKGQPAERHFITIDTKGSIENYPSYNTYVLATHNAVVYPSKASNGSLYQTSVLYFRDLKQNVFINQAIYHNWFKIVQPYSSKASWYIDSLVCVGTVLFILFGSFFWSASVMTGLVILIAIIWIITQIAHRGFAYGSLYKMGMHALTWPILVSELLKYIKFPISNIYTIVFMVWMLVIVFSQTKRKKK